MPTDTGYEPIFELANKSPASALIQALEHVVYAISFFSISLTFRMKRSGFRELR